MSMVLAIPVMDSHEWTQKTVASIFKTVRGEEFVLVVVDNNSVVPYEANEFGTPPNNVTLFVQRNERNAGFYAPLKDMYDAFGATHAYIGLMHNDLILYAQGWDIRMIRAFERDSLLSLIGLAGSYEVDENGGRGGGTMLWFRGEGQSQKAGLRISDLRPAVILDSLFMMFRTSDILLLKWEDKPTLAHFYDKIWPLRLIQQGKRVAVLGSECDHWGGITLVANARYEESCRQWLEAHKVKPHPDEPYNYGLGMYLEAQRRFQEEFSGKMYPCAVEANYHVTRGR